jgi:hypothetical protein
VNQIDEKFVSLGFAYSKAKKAHTDQLEGDVYELNAAITEIKESIVEEKIQREEGTEQTLAKVKTELERLEEDILIEQKVREETSSKLLTLIQEMENKLQKDIEVAACYPSKRPASVSSPTPRCSSCSRRPAPRSKGISMLPSNYNFYTVLISQFNCS